MIFSILVHRPADQVSPKNRNPPQKSHPYIWTTSHQLPRKFRSHVVIVSTGKILHQPDRCKFCPRRRRRWKPAETSCYPECLHIAKKERVRLWSRAGWVVWQEYNFNFSHHPPHHHVAGLHMLQRVGEEVFALVVVVVVKLDWFWKRYNCWWVWSPPRPTTAPTVLWQGVDDDDTLQSTNRQLLGGYTLGAFALSK